MSPTTVLIVSCHAATRENLRALLAGHDDLAVVGETADGESAVRLAGELHPDIVVMDLDLPGGGVPAVGKMLAGCPAQKILTLVPGADDPRIEDAVNAGAAGCLLRCTAGVELAEAVSAVAEGGAVISPSIAIRLARQYRGSPGC